MTEEQKRLVEENIDLVPYMVHKHFKFYFDKQELISIGNIGLVKAAKKYKIKQNIKFSTFACRCIKNEIKTFFYIMQFQKRTLPEGTKLHSFDYPFYEDDSKPVYFHEIISDGSDVSQVVENRLLIEKMLSILNERERKFVTLKFLSDRELNLREIGKILNFNSKTVWFTINSALKKIKSEFKDAI